jgi:WD40 repeat protein
MSRTDELTGKLLDGTLTEAEWAELDLLLAADPVAAEAHIALLDLEGVLRGMLEAVEVDLAAPTMAKVKEAQADKTTQAVMAEIATLPAPHWAGVAKPERIPVRSARRWLYAAAGMIAIAAGLLIGLWLGTRNPQPEHSPDSQGAASSADFAKLTQSYGSVELLTPQGDVLPASEGREVPPGHTLRTVGEDSLARVEMPDQTTVDIEPDSVVKFVAVTGSATAKTRLFLAAGQLTAAVPDRAGAHPLVVGTGIAEVFAKKGTFVVSSAGPESARVDIKHGNVEVVRMDTPSPVRVNGGSAFFQAGFAKVVTESGLRVDRNPARTLQFTGPRDAVFVPGSVAGKYDLWVASARQFTLWTSDGGTADTPLVPRKGDGQALFARDHSALVTCSGPNDKTVIRNLPSGEERVSIDIRFPEIRFRAVAPRAEWVAIAEPKPNHKTVRVYDGFTGQERFAYEFDDTVGCVTASPDGKTLAVGVFDSTRAVNAKLVLLDPVSGERRVSLPTHKRGPVALVFSADGRYLAAGFSGLVQIWDVQKRELVKSISGFERVVMCLAFGPDAKTIAAGTQDGQVWLWSVASGKPFQLLDVGSRGMRMIAFSPDGRRMVSVTNNSPVMLWDVAPVPDDAGDWQ